MDNITWVATLAGLALGLALVLVVLQLKGSSDSGVVYQYDGDNRLQAILPMKQPVELKPV